MWLQEAFQFLVSLGAANRLEFDADDDGVAFDKPVHRAPLPLKLPTAQPLEVSSLRAVARYLSAFAVDELMFESLFLHVAGPNEVELVSCLKGFHRQREVLVSAKYSSGVESILGRRILLEPAIVGLMTLFTGEGDRDKLLETLKSVKRADSEIREDDGLSQKVTVQVGTTTLATAKINNPVTLHPFSVFPEVAQPARLFVVRLAEGPTVQFEPADGEAWKVPAVEAVAQALEACIEEAGLDTYPTIIY